MSIVEEFQPKTSENLPDYGFLRVICVNF